MNMRDYVRCTQCQEMIAKGYGGLRYDDEWLCSDRCTILYLIGERVVELARVKEENCISVEDDIRFRGFTKEEAKLHQAGLEKWFQPTGRHVDDPMPTKEETE